MKSRRAPDAFFSQSHNTGHGHATVTKFARDANLPWWTVTRRESPRWWRYGRSPSGGTTGALHAYVGSSSVRATLQHPAAPSKLDILPCLIERRPAFAAFISGSVGRGAPVAAGRASSFVGTGGRSRVGVRARRGLRLGRSRSQAWTRRRRPRTRRAIHARLAWSVRCAPPQGRRPRVWARTMRRFLPKCVTRKIHHTQKA